MGDSDKLIIALEPAPLYFIPGQTVGGRLIVHSLRGVQARGLSVGLHGKIKVYWSVDRTPIGRIGTFHDTMTSDSYYHYYFRDKEDLFHFNQPLLTGFQNLSPGDTSFPFSFRLPENIPASITVTQDSGIEYFVTAHLESNQGKDHDWSTKMPIPVMAILDLRPFPRLSDPEEFHMEKTKTCCCCFTGKPVRMWCNLEKTGFYTGETIRFRVRIENMSGTKFEKMTARLKQASVLRAGGSRDYEEYTIAKVVRPQDMPIPKRGEDFWQGELQIPMVTPPSGLGLRGHGQDRMYGQQPLISMTHILSIMLEKPQGKPGAYPKVSWDPIGDLDPELSCTITIGVFPPSTSSV